MISKNDIQIERCRIHEGEGRQENQAEPGSDSEQFPNSAQGLASPALLHNASLSMKGREGRGSNSVRAAAMQNAQRTYGNRAVQRAIQRIASANPEAGTADDLAKRIDAKAGSGSGIDVSIRSRLEEGLGADLSGVRLHTDGEADMLARSVDSLAFTTGQDIFFSAGMYNPYSPEGLRTLAHEATHTVQQSQGPVNGTPSEGGVSISDPSDGFEQEAERAADGVLAGQSGTLASRNSLSSPSQSTGGGTNGGVQWRAVQRWGWQRPTGGDMGGYLYANKNRRGGLEVGAGYGGEGTENGSFFDRIGGDLFSINGTLGPWSENDGSDTRIGFKGSAGLGKAHYKGNGWGFDLGGFTASSEVSVGTNGATIGAQANEAELNGTLGSSDPESPFDTSLRVGVNAGPGAGGRLHWGDKDKDGLREVGFGIDAGPVSMDLKSELPSLISTIPLWPFGAPHVGDLPQPKIPTPSVRPGTFQRDNQSTEPDQSSIDSGTSFNPALQMISASPELFSNAGGSISDWFSSW